MDPAIIRLSGVNKWFGDLHVLQDIDLVLATIPLADRLHFALVDRNARKGTKPSDHTPLITCFSEAGQPN